MLLFAAFNSTPILATTDKVLVTYFTDDGYRQKLYRSPVLTAPQGVKKIDTATLHRWLHANKRQLYPINVLPATWVHKQFINTAAVQHIPHSVWLPNTGYGVLSPTWQHYFATALQVLKSKTPDSKLVFYCKVDCWMAWNAAKRAANMGYTDVYWYADGIDEWLQMGHKTVACEPQIVHH